MATTRTEWSYVKNLDGSLSIVDTTPDNVVRSSSGGWKYKEGNHTWICIDNKTHKPERDFIFGKGLHSYLDLSDIPEPSYEGDPILIVVTISTNYYYTDGSN